jgi:hypothetical protein
MGLRILGSPLGSPKFQGDYTKKFTSTLVKDTLTMCTTLNKPQTVTQLYCKCLVTRVPFQLTADILTNVNPLALPKNNIEWASALKDAVRQTTHDIIGHATGLDKIPEYALEMARIPKSLHMLGFTSPERIAVLSFLLLLFRTLRYATSGVPLQHKKVTLGSYFKELFGDWATSDKPLFVIMRHYATPIAKTMHMPSKFSGMEPLSGTTWAHSSTRG